MNGFLLASALVSALVGYAMKRGGLCTYAAVLQWVRERRLERFGAFLGVSAWAALLLAALVAFDPLPFRLSGSHALWGFALGGGALLGFGAWLNRGCVFGTFVQLVGGHGAYLATLAGMAAGSALLRLLWPEAAPALSRPAPLAAGTGTAIGATLVIAGALLFVVNRGRGPGRRAVLLVLGAGGGWLFATLPGWDFTAAVNRVAYRLVGLEDAGVDAATLGVTGVAMLVGGLLAAFTRGGFRWRTPSTGALLRHFGGGAAMGIGAVLVPGGNDGLLLAGMPALAAHAAVAWVAMLLTMWLLLAAGAGDRGYRMPSAG